MCLNLISLPVIFLVAAVGSPEQGTRDPIAELTDGFEGKIVPTGQIYGVLQYSHQ